MDAKKISMAVGLTIVIGTHAAMIVDLIPMSTMLDKQTHAVANLAAAGMIIYATYA